jgi:hypothetical protein
VQQSSNTIEGTLRNLYLVHSLNLFSMVLYIWIAEKLIPHPPQVLQPVLPIRFGVISLWIIGTAISKRRKMIRPAIDTLQVSADDQNALQRWRIGTILSDTLVQSVALFGFAQRFIGATAAQSAPFYLAGTPLVLLCWPRRP